MSARKENATPPGRTGPQDIFRTLFDCAGDAAFLLSADGRILKANQLACSSLGYDPGELLGLHVSEIDAGPGHTSGRINARLQNLGPEEILTVTTRHRRRDGSLFPVELSIRNLELEGQRYILTFARDISDRQRAEDAFRRLVQGTAATGRTFFDELVRALAESLGASQALVGELDSDNQELHVLACWSNGAHCAPFSFAYSGTEQVRREGDTFECDRPEQLAEPLRARGATMCRGIMLCSSDGEHLGVMAVAHDAPLDERLHPAELLRVFAARAASELDRLHTERELAARETRFRALIEQSADAILLFKEDGTIAYGSPAVRRILGYELEALQGVHFRELVLSEERGLAEATFRALLERPAHSMPLTIQLVHQDQHKVWVEAVATNLLAEPAVGGVVANFRDISERSKAEEQRTRLEEQLRQAQKMESVGRLAGGIAHDFNNLLTVVLGYTETLLAQLRHDPLARDRLLEIQCAGERAAALVQQLLAFSRKQVLQPRVLDLNQLVSETARLLSRLIGEHIELRTRMCEQAARVYADPTQLTQVVLNLAVNARDAMSKGGILSLEVALVRLEQLEGELAPGRYVRLKVQDTGCGMDAEVRAHLFEPFFTTKERGKGTGLGLATVYGIVKQSGGTLSVVSAPGEGSTFTLHFPEADPLVAIAGARPKRGDVGGNETILLVEDQERVRALTSALLASLGYRVLAAGDGSEALRLSREEKAPIHLLLTDVVLPGMSGVHLAEALRSERPDMKVLLTSGYSDDALDDPTGVHALPLLEKPFGRETLGQKVREVLDRS